MTVSEYLQNISVSQKHEFERIRRIVRSIVPEAEETISYGMPTFKHRGKYVMYFGAFKNHMSIFPGPTTDSVKDKLQGFKLAKGTIQFTEENPIPESVIQELARKRVAEIDKK